MTQSRADHCHPLMAEHTPQPPSSPGPGWRGPSMWQAWPQHQSCEGLHRAAGRQTGCMTALTAGPDSAETGATQALDMMRSVRWSQGSLEGFKRTAKCRHQYKTKDKQTLLLLAKQMSEVLFFCECLFSGLRDQTSATPPSPKRCFPLWTLHSSLSTDSFRVPSSALLPLFNGVNSPKSLALSLLTVHTLFCQR